VSQSTRTKSPKKTWNQSRTSYRFPCSLWRNESNLFRSCSLCTDQFAAAAGAFIQLPVRPGNDCERLCLLGDHGEQTLVSGWLDSQVSTKHELPGQEANTVYYHWECPNQLSEIGRFPFLGN
jgi:hypothetical protein